MASAQDVVNATYAAFFAGDRDGALDHCAADGLYHPVTMPEGDPPETWKWGRGSQPLRTYFSEILPAFQAQTPDYVIESMESEEFEGLVITKLRGSEGAGVMVFRVADEKLTDIWVISADGREVKKPF